MSWFPKNEAQELGYRRDWKAAFNATFSVIAQVLALRVLVLVAIAGGISMTYLALQNPDAFRIGALVVYCGGVVGPTIWLAGRG